MLSSTLSLDLRNSSSRRLCSLTLAAVAALPSLPLEAASERPSPDFTPASLLSQPEPEPLPARMTDDLAPAEAPTPEPSEVPRVRVHLQIVGTAEVTTVDLPLDGNLGPADARAIAHLFRCRRTHRERPIDPRVLAFLADVATQWPEHAIEIVSGFRAPPYGAPHSKHFKGQAIDLRVHGVRTTKLRDYVWREHRGIGVGYYERENFVHMDTRAGETDQAWTASDEGGEQNYNPRWALKARRAPPSAAHPMVAATPAPTSPPPTTVAPMTVAPTVCLAIQSNSASSL